VYTKLEEITSIQMAANDQRRNVDGETIIHKLEEMNEAANMIKHEIKELSKKEDQAKQVTITRDLSLPIRKSIEEKISKLVTNLNPSPEVQPSVRPKEQSKDEHPAKDSKDTKTTEGSGDSNTGSIIEMRRGLLFASSIGLGVTCVIC
jgi:hypothetical protein